MENIAPKAGPSQRSSISSASDKPRAKASRSVYVSKTSMVCGVAQDIMVFLTSIHEKRANLGVKEGQRTVLLLCPSMSLYIHQKQTRACRMPQNINKMNCHTARVTRDASMGFPGGVECSSVALLSGGMDGASNKLDYNGTIPNQTPTCCLEDTRFTLDEPSWIRITRGEKKWKRLDLPHWY